MRYRFKNTRQEHGREHRGHQRALRPARWLRLIGGQPGQAMAEKRRRGGLQQKSPFRIGQFRERGNQVAPVAALNHALVAGELPIQGKTRTGQPDERMKPQHTQAGFVDEACQVVAPSGVSQFVDEHGVDLRST